MSSKLLRACVGAALVVAGLSVQAAEKRSFCVFDPLGASGPLFNAMKDTKVKALSWGYDLEMSAFTDEKVAADDFRAGQCDMVLLTDVRAREFNKFAGSLVAVGAIPGYDELRTLLQTLATPKAEKLMTNGNYEVIGMLPAGSVYVFVRDKSINSVETIQGRKVAAFDYDPAAVTMVRHVGASVVPASPSSFAGKFNNGSVDVAYAPAVAYKPLELYKGTQQGGGIFKYPFAQMTFQIIAHKDRFKPGLGNMARAYFYGEFDKAMETVKKAEAEIPANEWVIPKPEQREGFDKMLRDVRIALKEQGVYDEKALRLMLKVRCKKNPQRAECVDGRE
ncbi:MAG: hypothetical protein D6758_08935 [Gammaproteobacteria bacterium]|nr:MAG: hypothetical protein D6758_08935 [Gammaproteobacteria bacterium]